MAKDYTKYKIEGLGENLNKRQLVFTIVKDYVSKNKISLEELKNIFPDNLEGTNNSWVFISKESEVKDLKRFNMKEPLSIKNGVHVVVSNQWGQGNLKIFLSIAEGIGYKIEAQDYIVNQSSSDLNNLSIDFENINSNQFKNLIITEIENNDDDSIVAIYNSLVDYLNDKESNRGLGWYVILFLYTLDQYDWEVDYDINRLNYNINTETYFFFNPESQSDSYWESTSDFEWTDPISKESGSFLELLLKRLGLTNFDDSLLEEKLDNVAVTYFWFSMSQYLLINDSPVDDEELAKLMWTVFEDPFHSKYDEIDFCGETPGANAIITIITDLLGFDSDHFSSEENDDMEPYDNYTTDYKAVAREILERDIFDDIILE